MRSSVKTWFATVTPDGKYGKPHPFSGAVEIPGVETNHFCTLLIDSSHGLSGSCVAVFDELILGQRLWRKLGLGVRPRIWEAAQARQAEPQEQEEGEQVSESITKELREWAPNGSKDVLYENDLIVMANQIDKAYEDGVRKAALSSRHESDEMWFQALDDVTDEWLAEHGLVRLPVDAAGRTWHVGDLYTLRTDRSHNVERLEWMEWDGDCWQLDGEDAGELVRYEPTPAERIRAAVQELANEDGSDGTALSDLLKIADELEAEHE